MRRFPEKANSPCTGGIYLSMRMKATLSTFLLAGALVCVPGMASSQPFTPGQDSPKQDMKDAGHETKNAAKDAGHGVKTGTKKAYHSTKRGTKKAWHKTKSTVKGGAEGAKEGAKQPQ
jgi:Ni/Co efflux regulator RcnB